MPKLLKLRGDTNEAFGELRENKDRILNIVQGIASALCEWIKMNKKGFETPEYKQQYELKPYQKVRIEDLLQIFVDDLALSKQFLSFVVDELGPKFSEQLEKEPSELTQINLHHRLLEYMLYIK